MAYGEALSAATFLASDPTTAATLLDKAERALVACVASITHALLDPSLLSNPSSQWLSSYVEKWQWYIRRVNLLCSILVGLDSHHSHQTQPSSLHSIAQSTWKNGPLSKGVTRVQLRKGLKEWIDSERTTKQPHDRLLIKGLIESLLTLGEYKNVFELPLANITTTFYRTEADACRNSMDSVAFLEHAEMRVLQEEERCREVMPLPSLPVIVAAAECELWGADSQASWILSEALPKLLKAKGEPSSLIRLHNLFSRSHSLEILYRAFGEHLLEAALTMINLTGEEEGNMIPNLLDLKLLIDKVARPLGDKRINQEVDAAFTKAFKKRPGKAAEMMAKYIDRAMREKKQDTGDDFPKLKQVLDMYRYTSGELRRRGVTYESEQPKTRTFSEHIITVGWQRGYFFHAAQVTTKRRESSNC